MSYVTPDYDVQVFAFGASFGIGRLLADFKYVKNLGYADTLNDVPEMFFTLDQDDPQLDAVAGYEGKAHVRVRRNNEVVWAGWFGMEHDANERDVIFTCYGYLAGLYFLASAWNVQYKSATIGTIVSDAWTRAKTTITSSPLAFVTTGTLESPVTTSGGATAITLPQYSMFYKRLLFTMKEMAALAISDTTNTVAFEITHSTTPTFNFWKNRGVSRPDVVWEWGDGLMSSFKDYQLPIYRRNDILAVGGAPNSAVLRYEWVDPGGDASYYGTRQEPIYFQWVRDQTELQRATAIRGALAQRTTPDLALTFTPNSVLPPGVTGSGFRLSDTARVRISRGVTQINAGFLITAYKVLVINGQEHIRVNLQQPSGT